MTSRRLLILSIAALLAIGAGLWLANRASSPPADERSALYPTLKQELDAIKSVRIFKAGDTQAVELTHESTGWGVSERGGYAADEAKVRTLLRALADARLFEEKTSTAENYARLGVEEVSDPKATGVRVELTGAPTAANLIVGKSGPGSQSRYVRRAGEAQSWMINSALDAPTTPDAWLQRDILTVAADRIQSAKITLGSQPAYAATKSSRADADFSVTGLPKSKKLDSPTAASGVATALTGLTLLDVKRADALDQTKPAAHATFTTFDGLIVELEGRVLDEKHFIKVKPSFDAALAERFKTPVAEPANAEEAKTDQAAAAEKSEVKDVAAEAQAASARTEGWLYEIPDYKYEQIFKPLDELT